MAPQAIPSGEREAQPAIMDITVRIRDDVARSLHQLAPPSAESQRVLRTVSGAGLTFTPLHPGTGDPRLVRYFKVTVPDPATAEHVIARLWELPAIEAAYITPPSDVSQL
jgi:hypothetical protein